MNGEIKKVLLFTSESCGYGDSVIGYEALSNVLDIMIKRDKKPAAVVCINTAVMLLGMDSPLLPRFKKLEEQGVEIMAGRMCVNECGLTDSLGSGNIRTLTEIMEFLLLPDVDVISL